jgi:DNA-binding CsgD family transcriptional regulator
VRWPGWIEHYAVNGFVHEDIVIEETARSLEPFTWMDLQNRRPGEGNRVFEECTRFGWPDGFTVPVDGPDARRGLVSIASPVLLSSLTVSQRAELVTLSLSSYRQAFTLAMDQSQTSRRLSLREREALAHVAKGRDDTQIALLMSISTSTAHAHVERAKRRLGASTRAHAVALAITANLI